MSFKDFFEKGNSEPTLNEMTSPQFLTEIIGLDFARSILGTWDKATNHYKYNWDKEQYRDWFEKETGIKNAYRIYYSPQGKVLNVKNYSSAVSAEKIPAAPDAEVKKALGSADILEFLNKNGYTTDNQAAGFCVKSDGKMLTIGAALNIIGKKEKDKKNREYINALLNVYSKLNDTSVSVQDASKSDWILVISRHPYDILGISTDRDWRKEGIAWIYGKYETESGNFEGDFSKWKPGKWSKKKIEYDGGDELSGHPDDYTSSRQGLTYGNIVKSGGWVSCTTMNQKTGSRLGCNASSVLSYIKGNAMVAYVIKKKTLSGIRSFKTADQEILGGGRGKYNPEYVEFDTNLNQPTGRVIIYPYVNMNNHQIYLKPSTAGNYGKVERTLVVSIIDNFLRKYQKRLPTGSYYKYSGIKDSKEIPTHGDYYSDMGYGSHVFDYEGIDMSKYNPEVFEKLEVSFDSNSLVEEGDKQHEWMLDGLVDGTIILSKKSRLLLNSFGVTMVKGDLLKGDWVKGTWKSKGDFRGNTWHDGSFDNGNFYGKLWKSGIFRSSTGGFYGDVWEEGTFSVTKIGDTHEKTMMMGWHGKIWQGGTFTGTFHSGTWMGGTFKNGTWLAQLWLNGEWLNGTWKHGKWEKGEWYNGTWEDGTFKNGTWRDGVWYKGDWSGKKWCSGTWIKGTWHRGTWRSGVWEDGTWKTGKWLAGVWVRGIWEHGEFSSDESVRTKYKSSEVVGSHWLFGTWNSGVWYSGTWFDGIWEFGNFGTGIWKNGTWKSGSWTGGGIWEHGKNGKTETNLNPIEFEKEKKLTKEQ